MKLILILIPFLLLMRASKAQIDTVKVYICNASKSNEDGKIAYKINDEYVSKNIYEKYTLNKLDPPRLIYRKGYDIDENLIYEGLSFHYCWVGEYKEYHSNGNLAQQGSYSRINSVYGDLKDINGYEECEQKDGHWEFYNENGNLLFTEFWKNGIFLRQLPPQDIASIWKISLKLNGITFIDRNPINVDSIRSLEPLVFYKNQSKKCRKFSFKLSILRANNEIISKFFKSSNKLKRFKLRKLFFELPLKPGDRVKLYFLQECYSKIEYWEPTIIIPLIIDI